jgi:DNA replication protein DnaC
MSEPLVMERLQANLSRLRLQRASAVLSDIAAAAQQQSKSHLDFLDELLEEEVAHKEQLRVEKTLRIAGLPFVKTIDEFDFPFQPKLDKQQVKSLFDLSFIERRENVIFLGPPGVGKTHLAVSLAVKACRAGIGMCFTSMADLIVSLKRDHNYPGTPRKPGYLKASIVIVDEVGYTPVTREECNLFFRFISQRYERASTIITSNKAFADWAELFSDPVIVTAILDRLLHHSIVINIKGNSYRLRNKIGKEIAPQYA